MCLEYVFSALTCMVLVPRLRWYARRHLRGAYTDFIAVRFVLPHRTLLLHMGAWVRGYGVSELGVNCVPRTARSDDVRFPKDFVRTVVTGVCSCRNVSVRRTWDITYHIRRIWDIMAVCRLGGPLWHAGLKNCVVSVSSALWEWCVTGID